MPQYWHVLAEIVRLWWKNKSPSSKCNDGTHKKYLILIVDDASKVTTHFITEDHDILIVRGTLMKLQDPQHTSRHNYNNKRCQEDGIV